MSNNTKEQLHETILNSDEYFHSLLVDIKNAKQTIDLETYIFNDDDLGKRITRELMHAAEKGVKIRLLLDGIGTSAWCDNIKLMEEAGITVRVFNPLPLKLWQLTRANCRSSFFVKMLRFFTKINSRNHRKTCIIDSSIVYIGSINIAQTHLSVQQGGAGWMDVVVKITNINTKELQFAFDIAWYGFSLSKRIKKMFQPVASNSIFRLNYSRRQRRLFYRFLLKRISESRSRVWMTNAYFNPEYVLLRKLTKAAKRGVEVTILLSHDSDVFFMPLVAQAFYSRLLKAGVNIYEYLPSILHAKMFIIDDWYCVGSSNLNHRSLIHDLEVDVNIQTKEAKKILEKIFLQNIKKSHKISLANFKKIPLYKRILSQLLLYLRYFF